MYNNGLKAIQQKKGEKDLGGINDCLMYSRVQNEHSAHTKRDRKNFEIIFETGALIQSIQTRRTKADAVAVPTLILSFF